MAWTFTNRTHQHLLYLFLISVFGAVIRFIALNQIPYANGWDGYYYVMQAHSLIEYGKMQSLDYSLIYPYYTFISYLIGDYELAFKIGSAVISGLLICSLALLIYQVCRELMPALLVLSFMVFSPHVTYLIVQFPKNALGVTFIIGLLVMIDRKTIPGMIIMMLLAVLTHRMAAGFGFIILAGYAFQSLKKRWLIASIGVLILLSFLPGIFHYSDLSRFQGMFTVIPQLQIWSFYQLFRTVWNGWWSLDSLVLSLALGGIIYLYIKNQIWKQKKLLFRWVLPVLIGITLFPWMTMENGSMGYRFYLVAPVFIVSYLGMIAPKSSMLLGLSLSVLFLVMGSFSYKSYQPQYHDPPHEVYELITNRLKSMYSHEHIKLVVVHKSLAEMIIYKTEFDALNWEPKVNQIAQTLRVAHGLAPYHFSKYLGESEMKDVKKLTTNYYSLPESHWNTFVQSIQFAADHELMERIQMSSNPMKHRPDFLTKSK